MTVPNERREAVNRTYAFLSDLTDPTKTPRIPRVIRDRAASLLKHFPGKFYMDEAAQKAPTVFGTWDGKKP